VPLMATSTKRQHVVPRSYLSLWCAPGNSTVNLYDLREKRKTVASPKDSLVIKQFYEVPGSLPNNYIENLLAMVEGPVATILKEVHLAVESRVSSRDAVGTITDIERILNQSNHLALKRFAAFQYLRIPGAVEQKRYELENVPIVAEEKERHLKPGHFVDSGFQYSRDRFENELGLLIYFSFDDLFLTSDWPCFDFHDASTAPVLGEEIGYDKDVAAMLPLTPRVLAIFFPQTAMSGGRTTPQMRVERISPSMTRNSNTLTIQQSIRWIVSMYDEDFILRVAAKRKREHPDWQQRNTT